MDNFTTHVPPPCEEAVQVVYADDHVLVVDKPSGLLSVPGRFVKDCVLHRVLYDYPDARIVHRLDLDTSGLLILALTQRTTSSLNKQFRERAVGKEYRATVFGQITQDGEIELPIAPDPDNRPRQQIDHHTGKYALTRYESVRVGETTTDVLLRPLTGRSHQLRIHLAAIGHPILGCDLYAHDAALEASTRLCLHASRIQFSHPETGDAMVFESSPVF